MSADIITGEAGDIVSAPIEVSIAVVLNGDHKILFAYVPLIPFEITEESVVVQ